MYEFDHRQVIFMTQPDREQVMRSLSRAADHKALPDAAFRTYVRMTSYALGDSDVLGEAPESHLGDLVWLKFVHLNDERTVVSIL